MLERLWVRENTYSQLVKAQTGTTTGEINERFLKKNTENHWFTWSGYTTLGIYSKEFLSTEISSLFTIIRKWKQPRYPSIDKWIMKMSYIYTMECYLAFMKNKIMKSTVKRMELESLILSEVTQMQKEKFHIFSHFWMLAFNLQIHLFHVEYQQSSAI